MSAYAFMVFNLFSAPCFGVIGAMRKELGSVKKTIEVVCFQIVLAWCLAVLINQLGINFIFIMVIGIIVIAILKLTKNSKQGTKKSVEDVHIVTIVNKLFLYNLQYYNSTFYDYI